MLGAESNESAPPALNHGISLRVTRVNFCVCGTWEWPFLIPGAPQGWGHLPQAQGYEFLCKAAPWGLRSPSNHPPQTLCKQWECVVLGTLALATAQCIPQAPLNKLWQHNPKTYSPTYGIQPSNKCDSLPLQAPPKPTFCSSESLSVVVSTARSRMAPIFQPFCLKLVGFFPI